MQDSQENPCGETGESAYSGELLPRSYRPGSAGKQSGGQDLNQKEKP
jgi:hypothetical protein